jgi:hypothetical protein
MNSAAIAGFIFGTFIILFFIALYFVPTIIAVLRKHRNTGAIVALQRVTRLDDDWMGACACLGSDGAKQGMRIMNITPWKNWPESQRKRVLDEIALLVQTTITSFDKRVKSFALRSMSYTLTPSRMPTTIILCATSSPTSTPK